MRRGSAHDVCARSGSAALRMLAAECVAELSCVFTPSAVRRSSARLTLGGRIKMRSKRITELVMARTDAHSVSLCSSRIARRRAGNLHKHISRCPPLDTRSTSTGRSQLLALVFSVLFLPLARRRRRNAVFARPQRSGFVKNISKA